MIKPLLYERVNVQGTLNLLELCREFGVGKFLFGSSVLVYGASEGPFSEEQLDLRPISPYAATKLAGEMLCYTYAHLFNLQIICLRFFTVYGPRQRPDLAIHKFTALMEAGKPYHPFSETVLLDATIHMSMTLPRGLWRRLRHESTLLIIRAFESFRIEVILWPVKLTELVDLIERVTNCKAIRNVKKLSRVMCLSPGPIYPKLRLLGYRPQVRLEEDHPGS